MPTTYAKELAEARLGEAIGEWIGFYQGIGLSAPAIARILAAKTGVKVSGQTIRRWSREGQAA